MSSALQKKTDYLCIHDFLKQSPKDELLLIDCSLYQHSPECLKQFCDLSLKNDLVLYEVSMDLLSKLNLSNFKGKIASFYFEYSDGDISKSELYVSEEMSDTDEIPRIIEAEGRSLEAIFANSILSKLPMSHTRNYSYFDFFLDGILIFDDEKNVLYANEPAANRLGVSVRRIKSSKKIYDFIQFDDKNLFCMPGGTWGKDSPTGVKEVSYTTKGGSEGHVQISLQPFPNTSMNSNHYVLYFHDVSLERELEKKYKSEASDREKAEEMALTDEMTGLYNFRAFQLEFPDFIKKCKRKRWKFGLVICDIDHFKKFNDSYGHQQGDLTLKTVANTLNKTVRNTDFIARYGGEEFVMLIAHVDTNSLRDTCERIRKMLEKTKVPMLLDDDKHLAVTASFGACVVDPKEEDIFDKLTEMIEKADKNLYAAKAMGRNCCVVE